MIMRFVWDLAKAESSHRKHDIQFEDAVHVFFDLYYKDTPKSF